MSSVTFDYLKIKKDSDELLTNCKQFIRLLHAKRSPHRAPFMHDYSFFIATNPAMCILLLAPSTSRDTFL